MRRDVVFVFRLDFCYAKIQLIPLIYNFLALIIQKKKHFDCPSGSIMKHLREFVSSVPEYRRTGKGNFKHKLEDILMLVILGRLSKCITRAEIIEFGERHLKRFQSMGMLLDGVPSEATLSRVFKSIDDEQMAARMSAFVDIFRKEIPSWNRDIISVDGKALRGTVYKNGRNPDIVSAYSFRSGLTLATDVCKEKSNEIKSVPRLLDKIDILGCIVTADAMSLQKSIIDKIRQKGGDFVIELKANQRSLRYGLEDKIKTATPKDVYTQGPCLEHGRIETRTCRIFGGEEFITDKEKWNGGLTVIEILTDIQKKSNGQKTSEQRLYISSLESSAKQLGLITRQHWAIESMHWNLDRNLRQDNIKRKTERAARNLDTIQRMVLALFAIWKNKRRKVADKRKGTAELARGLSLSFTKLLLFLAQK